MKRKLIKYALLGTAALFTLLLAYRSEANEWHLLQIREVSAQYKSFLPGTRDPLFVAGKPPTQEINYTIGVDVAKYLFWDFRLHSMTDADQYRVAGLNMKLGLRLSPLLPVTVQYEHFSRHLLDSTYPYSRFPVEDSIGFTLYFYGGPR